MGLKLTIADPGTVAPAPRDVAGREEHLWISPDGTFWASGYTADGEHVIDLPGVASFRFGGRSGEVTAIARPSVDRAVIADAFRRDVLPVALQALGREVLHASAVLGPRGVVALCGYSGTGKSTIAYGLSRRGYPLWADDAVAVDPAGPRVRAIPLPFEIRLRPASAAFFAEDPTAAHASGGPNGADRAGRRPPLAAVCVLARVPAAGDGAGCEVARLSSAEAFVAVLAHSFCFSLRDEARKRRMMEHYLDLTARVPILEVRFAGGLETLSATLDGIERAVDQALTASA
jgi:hypothetical protein